MKGYKEKKCADCGKPIGLVHGAVKRCEACQKKAQKRSREKQSAKRRGGAPPVSMLGYHSMSLDEKIKAANAAGLSYGQYVSKMGL